MSLTDDINNLPVNPENVMPGHLGHHATIHSALKDHNSRFSEISIPPTPGTIPRRESTTGNIRVANTPDNNYHAASKIYVDGKIPDGLSLRQDTTVGTRIFAGNTMIHGDTGWRVLPHHSDNEGLTGDGRILMRRQGDLITTYFDQVGVVDGDGAGLVLHTRQIPSGFHFEYRVGTILTLSASNSSFDYASLRVNTSLWYLSRTRLGRYTTLRENIVLGGEVQWVTADSWPTTLPGTPA